MSVPLELVEKYVNRLDGLSAIRKKYARRIEAALEAITDQEGSVGSGSGGGGGGGMLRNVFILLVACALAFRVFAGDAFVSDDASPATGRTDSSKYEGYSAYEQLQDTNFFGGDTTNDVANRLLQTYLSSRVGTGNLPVSLTTSGSASGYWVNVLFKSLQSNPGMSWKRVHIAANQLKNLNSIVCSQLKKAMTTDNEANPKWSTNLLFQIDVSKDTFTVVKALESIVDDTSPVIYCEGNVKYKPDNSIFIVESGIAVSHIEDISGSTRKKAREQQKQMKTVLKESDYTDRYIQKTILIPIV
jgi:hypothetical protein